MVVLKTPSQDLGSSVNSGWGASCSNVWSASHVKLRISFPALLFPYDTKKKQFTISLDCFHKTKVVGSFCTLEGVRTHLAQTPHSGWINTECLIRCGSRQFIFIAVFWAISTKGNQNKTCKIRFTALQMFSAISSLHRLTQYSHFFSKLVSTLMKVDQRKYK